jgi:hypothetical protein
MMNHFLLRQLNGIRNVIRLPTFLTAVLKRS